MSEAEWQQSDPWAVEANIDFANCSRVAADACEYAENIAKLHPGGGQSGDFFIVGYADQLTAFATPLDGHVKANDSVFRPHVLQPLNPDDMKIEYKRNWRLKKVVAPYKQPAAIGAPILAVDLPTGAYLPLATFQRKEAGTCNYVQLLSEMDDDQYFLTMLDEQTPRYEMVEAIAELLKASQRYSNPSPNEQTLEVLGRILEHQLGVKTQEVEKAEFAVIAHTLSLNMLRPDGTRQLKIIEPDGRISVENVTYRQLGWKSQLADGRIVELATAKGERFKDDSNYNFFLLAVTRGDMALPLAQVFPGTSEIRFNGPRGNEVGDAVSLIEALRKMADPFLFMEVRSFTDADEALPSNIAQYYPNILITELCWKKRLVDPAFYRTPTEIRSDKSYKTFKTSAEGLDIIRRTEDWLNDPSNTKTPPSAQAAAGKATDGKLKLQALTRQAAAALNLQERFRILLGECTPDEELLVNELQDRIAIQRMVFSGKLGGMALKADSNVGTDMFVRFEITPSPYNGSINLRVFDRPYNMPDESEFLRINETLDLTKPVHESWSKGDASAWISSVLGNMRRLVVEQ